ncbi:uncharacterized protein LOC144124139 [Amblyomma americanum]
MQPLSSQTLLGLYLLSLSISFSHAEPKRQLQHDVTDAFKMFKTFPVAIALFDEDQDGDLDCLKAVRADFDEDAHTVTYVWILKNENGHDSKNISYHLKEGASPDKPVYTLDDTDGPEYVANFIYTDYETCVILEIPYKENQECILWTTEGAKNGVPKHCMKYYIDNCDVKNMAYDQSCDAV